MKKYPLGLYVIGVIIVLALVNYIAWSVGGVAKLQAFKLISAGFLFHLKKPPSLKVVMVKRFYH